MNNFVLLFLLFAAVNADYLISSASELATFASKVNSGSTFIGTTVLLTNDIYFTSSQAKAFVPIGKDKSYYFLGTFDGQGYTIRNLNLASTNYKYIGLFGYSRGLTIRNLVVDSSCSIVSSYTPSSVFIAGIIGWCEAASLECHIKNSVNMADISFSNVDGWLYLGGICGYLNSPSKVAYVDNSANYGTITNSGYSNNQACIAGITGYVEGYTSYSIYIRNCLNYGPIIHSGRANSDLNIGGIGGYSYCNVYYFNCMSVGKISSCVTSTFIGAIAGWVKSSSYIAHSYWTSNVGYNKANGDGSSTVSQSNQVALSSSSVSELNSYATNKGWNTWLYNSYGSSIGFEINDGDRFYLNSNLILLPNILSRSGYTFSGWYTDVYCSNAFSSTSVYSSTTLYGGWKSTLSFKGNSGTVTQSSKIIIFGKKYGTLPTPTRTGYNFDGWYTSSTGGSKKTQETTVTSVSSETLYAHWTAKQFTVTFNGNGGTPSQSSKTVTYDSTYESLPLAERKGYNFDGWHTTNNGGTKIISTSKVAITSDQTIYAHWIANNYTVTLNVNGDDALPVNGFTVTYDKPYNCLPNVSRTGHTFVGWFTEENGGSEVTNETTANITADNHTLYAQWTINNYTLTFDFGNGTVVNETLKYNETIVYPKNLTREECVFSGWKPKPDRMSANDTTVVAQ